MHDSPDFRGVFPEDLGLVRVFQLLLHVVLLQNVDDAEEVGLGPDLPVELSRMQTAHLLLPVREEGLVALVLLLAVRLPPGSVVGRGLHRDAE